MRAGRESGFSLIELSIVALIIGLLIGAVLSGRWLIRGSELQKIINGKNQLAAAVAIFEARFNQPPGDYTNNDGQLPGAVGGDGNGIIAYINNGASGLWDEEDNVYVHLYLAGLIPGPFVTANLSIAGAPTVWSSTTAPVAPQTNTVFWIGSHNVDEYGRTALTGNFIVLTGLDYRQGSMRLDDAIALDYKYDDGIASTGAIRAYQPWGGTPGGNNCVSAVRTAASATYLNTSTVAASNQYDCVVEVGNL